MIHKTRYENNGHVAPACIFNYERDGGMGRNANLNISKGKLDTNIINRNVGHWKKIGGPYLAAQAKNWTKVTNM